MGMFALRVPDEMKKEMDQIRINWSEYLRNSIDEAIQSKEKRNLFQKLHQINSGQPFIKRGTSERIIRQMRDHG